MTGEKRSKQKATSMALKQNKTTTTTSTKSSKPAGKAKVTEETSTPAGASSFYSEDLEDVDTSFALLREDSYVCEFVSYAEEPSKNSDRTFGHFVLKTAEPGRDVNGKPIGAGYPLHKRVNLTESEDRDLAMIRKDLARVVRDGFQAKRISDLRPGDRVLVRVRNSRERTDEKTGRTYSAASEPASFKPVSR